MPSHPFRRLRRLLALTFLALPAGAAGCDDPNQPVPVASLELRVAEPFVEVGDTLHVRATLRDASGEELSRGKVVWSSTAEGIATVRDGVVTGRAPGEAVIVAASGRVADSVAVKVEPAVDAIKILPDSVSLRAGESVELRVSVSTFGAPSGSVTVRWTTSDSSIAVAAQSSPGAAVVRTAAPGAVTLTARAGKKSARVVVTVERPYTLTLLGTLGEGKSHARAVDELGRVVGTVVHPDHRKEAFVWENGTMTSLGPGEALDIGPGGRIVGGDGRAAVMWENGVKTVLYEKAGGVAVARAINRHGHVVGDWRGSSWCSTGGQCPGTVFLYRDGVVTEIIPSATNAEGHGINDDGWVVGVTGSSAHYRDRAYIYRNDVLTELRAEVSSICNTPCGGATDVNERGEIVGSGPYSPLVYWASPDTLGIRLPVAYPVPGARLNDHGEILYGPVLRRGSEQIELNRLVGSSDWSIGGTGLNNRGQIVGSGRNRATGVEGAVLLTPPE